MSLEADFNVFALSLNKKAGSPLRDANRLNASRMDFVDRLITSSKLAALVYTLTCKEANIVLLCPIRSCYIEWTSKVHPGIRKGRVIVNSPAR